MKRDPERLIVAGALYEGLDAPEDAIHHFPCPALCQTSLIYPVGRQRFRTYFVSCAGSLHIPSAEARTSTNSRPHAPTQVCRTSGSIMHVSSLAAYPGADSWVDHPYARGVVLVGDAATASGPSWGAGLSLTLRDVRVLLDRLLANEDWDAAAHAYALEHDRYYGALHRVHDWFAQLQYERGKQADERRARVLPCFKLEPDRMPDTRGLGPEAPSDEAARWRFFVEDGFLRGS